MNLGFTVYGTQFHLKPKSVILGHCSSKCIQYAPEEEQCQNKNKITSPSYCKDIISIFKNELRENSLWSA